MLLLLLSTVSYQPFRSVIGLLRTWGLCAQPVPASIGCISDRASVGRVMEARCTELSKMSPTCTDTTSNRLLETTFAAFATFAIAEAAVAFAAFATEGGSIAI